MVAALCTLAFGTSFAGSENKGNSNEAVPATVVNEEDLQLEGNVTAWVSKRNGNTPVGNDAEYLDFFMYPDPAGGSRVFHTSSTCRTWWLNQKVDPECVGTGCKTYGYYFFANGTATVNDQTTFMIACPL